MNIAERLTKLYYEHREKHGKPPDVFQLTRREYDELYEMFRLVTEGKNGEHKPPEGFAATFMGVPLQIIEPNKRCFTCKYWDAPDIIKNGKISMWEPLLGFALGLCTHSNVVYRYPKHDAVPEVDGVTIGADGKKIKAVEMQTGPDFGCIHHEEKSE